MYKKASRRTGGSSLAGWSTRKQTEARIDVENVRLVTGWKRPQSARSKAVADATKTESLLLRKGSDAAVLPKDKFRLALQKVGQKFREAAEAKREKLRKHQQKKLARIKDASAKASNK